MPYMYTPWGERAWVEDWQVRMREEQGWSLQAPSPLPPGDPDAPAPTPEQATGQDLPTFSDVMAPYVEVANNAYDLVSNANPHLLGLEILSITPQGDGSYRVRYSFDRDSLGVLSQPIVAETTLVSSGQVGAGVISGLFDRVGEDLRRLMGEAELFAWGLTDQDTRVPFDYDIGDFDISSGGSSGGGGGFGGFGSFVQPSFQYLAPDRAEVEEAMKTTLVAMTGKADKTRIKLLTNLYMQADRDRALERHRLGTEAAKTDFEKQKTAIEGGYARGTFIEGEFVEGEDINPLETVRNRIRSFADYQAIHNLRPGYIDEMQWVGTQQGAAAAAGGRLSEAGQQGIDMAIAGVNPTAVTEAVSFQESIAQRRTLPGFFQSMQRVAGVVREML